MDLSSLLRNGRCEKSFALRKEHWAELVAKAILTLPSARFAEKATRGGSSFAGVAAVRSCAMVAAKASSSACPEGMQVPPAEFARGHAMLREVGIGY